MECQRGLATSVCLSVCLSVRPSVRPSVNPSIKGVICDKTKESFVNIVRTDERSFTLFCDKKNG